MNAKDEQALNSEDLAFQQFASSAYFEFTDVADYIWKSPRLIESEFKLEIEKLNAYFPVKGDDKQDAQNIKYRKMRWQHERKKLTAIFPYLMATGNLFSIISLFETYCFILCKELDVQLPRKRNISFTQFPFPNGNSFEKCST
jgi:hypothetical protein